MSGRYIVEKYGVVERLQPIRFGQSGVRQHRPRFVEESAVESFRDAVVLWRVGGCHFVADAALFEVLLYMCRSVLPTPVRAEGFDFKPCFQFGSRDERFEVLPDFRFLAKGGNRGVAGLVVGKGDEVFVASV
jgi:hypothetical protein